MDLMNSLPPSYSLLHLRRTLDVTSATLQRENSLCTFYGVSSLFPVFDANVILAYSFKVIFSLMK